MKDVSKEYNACPNCGKPLLFTVDKKELIGLKGFSGYYVFQCLKCYRLWRTDYP
jgi:DNA-directed RNA polymerase subunit RPC12/RpoP